MIFNIMKISERESAVRVAVNYVMTNMVCQNMIFNIMKRSERESVVRVAVNREQRLYQK